MQMKERSLAPGLPEVLDQALARLQAGESVEACLDAYPQHATVLEPLLRAGDLLNAQAAISLPPEMDTWLATGAHDFAAIAAQLPPKYTKPLQTTRQRIRAGAPAQQPFDDILDFTIARAGTGTPLAACLAEFPDHAPALEPLLRLSTRLHAAAATPLPAELAAWLPTGRREFMALAEQMAPRYAQQRRRSAARRLTAQRAAIAVLVVAVTMGAVDSASAQSLPGDTLYPWKRARENIELALVADPAQRSQMLVEFADRRLTEFNTLVAAGHTIDSAVVAETLNSLLDNVQGALAVDQRAPQAGVTPRVKQILAETRSAITQASTSATSTPPALNDALARADQIAQEIPAVPTTTALPPGSAPTDAPSAIGGPSNGGNGRPQPTTAPVGGQQNTNPTLTPAPTAVGAPAATPVPTSGGATASPLPLTDVPANTATPDPATAIPPTAEPSVVPTAGATNTPPAENPTGTATEQPVPTATGVPVTEVPTEPPPPTVPPTARPTRPPLPTDTPTDVPTSTPTDAPTDTPTDAPTSTPTDVPTSTPTDVPTSTPTDVPTDTPVPATAVAAP